MAAHQAPPSLGFSRQEHWSGLPFPSPMHESEKCKGVTQLCPTLGYPMDCSLPGSSIHGIFQARVLEWGAIAFSNYLYYINIYAYIYLCKCVYYSVTIVKFEKYLKNSSGPEDNNKLSSGWEVSNQI